MGRRAKPATTASPTTRALFERAHSLGMKQYWIAMKLNIEPQTLCRWKTGRTNMTVPDAEAFAELVGGKVEYVSLQGD